MSEIKLELCSICESHNLQKVIELKNLPHTGIYIPDSEHVNANDFIGDNSFMLCSNCGHGQLAKVLDLDFHYDSNRYWLRTSTSTISRNGVSFYIQFLEKLLAKEKKQPKRVLEIGCNDLYLLKQINTKFEFCLGVDPIWKGKENGSFQNVRIIGDFIQNVDSVKHLEGSPDLILSEHAFEHIHDPYTVFQHLVEKASDNALFVIEVPGIEPLIANLRFDQIFHQHVQYYGLSSLKYLINRLGCEYVDHVYNYDYWGALIIAFRKKATSKNSGSETPQVDHILNNYTLFKQNMLNKKEILERLKKEGPVYGLGAAQMLALVAYHMETDFSFLLAVLDDDARKLGMKYPNLPVKIQAPNQCAKIEESTIAVLAQDYTRILTKRALELNPRRIVIPKPII